LRTWLIRAFWFVFILALLVWALVAAPLAEIWGSLIQLQFWQITLLLVISFAAILLITLRWWLIVRAESSKVSFLKMVGYRLAAFGMSYFTPGPQV
jgi:uncharacterized membrane protein YbhN (UPF0104 family)